MSTYGPAKNAPASLLEGSEFSFEELRLRFYELASQGNQQLANEEANGLWAKNEAAIQEIVHKVDNVAKFIEEAEGRHPNRHDLCKIDGSKSIDQVKEEFQNGIPGGFGHSSSSGGVSTPFTQPTTAPAFGQRSGFGQPIGSTPSFGKPTQPGTFGQPAFGQPSAPSQAPAFGEPSRPQPAPAFGQPSQPSGFGQPSKPPGFGQPAFGQPSQPSQPSTFGTSNPFVKSPNSAAGAAPAFGQPSAPGNTFGQPSFGAAGSGHAVPAFGRPTTSGGGFGQPSQPQSTSAPSYPFGRPPIEQFNPFNTSSQPGPTTTTTTNNQAPTAGGSFGQPPAPTSGLSPTNGPAPKTTTGANHPLTGQPSAAITYTQTLPNVPSTTRQVTDSVTKRPKTILVTYKGCKVEYKEDKPCYQRPDGKGFERIFFPDGEPVVRKEDVEPDQSKYTDEVFLRTSIKTI